MQVFSVSTEGQKLLCISQWSQTIEQSGEGFQTITKYQTVHRELQRHDSQKMQERGRKRLIVMIVSMCFVYKHAGIYVYRFLYFICEYI